MRIDANITFLAALGLFAIALCIFGIRRTVTRLLIFLTALGVLLIAVSLTQVAWDLFAAGDAYLPGGGRSWRTITRMSAPIAFWASTLFLWAATATAWLFGGWLLRIGLMRSHRA
jgi:hypothetical protein